MAFKKREVKSRLDAGTRGPRSGSLYRPVENVNYATALDLESTRGRSMGAALNSPLIGEALDQWVSDEIGSVAKIKPGSSNESVNSELKKLWDKHERFLDPNQEMNLASLLSVAVRERRTNGEVFIRLIRRKLGLYPAPMQVQIIQASQCPIGLNRDLSAGRKIIQGIEYRNGVKVAVWLKKANNSLECVRVPMSDIIHCKAIKWAGMVRAIPSTARALLKEGEYNSYQENELTRKKSQSAVVGMITADELDEDPLGNAEGDYTNSEKEVENRYLELGNNQFLIGRAGEGLVMNNSPDVGQNYKDFSHVNERMIGAGVGVPYQLVTSNYEGINDRTLRQINNNHRRKVRAERNQYTEFQIVNKLWRWFVDAAVLTGINIPNYWRDRDDYRKCKFSAEAFAYDHAVQDLQAAEKQVTLGVKSIQSICEERGEDWNKNLADKYAYLAEVEKLEKKYNIQNNGN